MSLDDNQSFYAIVKLEEAARVVKQSVSEMPSLRKRLDRVKGNKTKAREVLDNIQHQFDKLLSALDSAVLSLLEMELPDMVDYTKKLGRSIKSFNLMTPDYSKLCAVLSKYLTELPVNDTEEARTTNARVIGRMMRVVKMGYYPTDLDHIRLIARGIEFPEGIAINMLDPCCGCGLALRTLSEGIVCSTYGVELDGHRAEEALSRLNRVGFGSYFRSRISNEAFHVMLLNPPYLSVMTEGGNNARSEKRFLVDSFTHLMFGGLLIYIIPYYRLTVDICRVLCDNFDDVTIWKFVDEEFAKHKQVVVIGIRQKRVDGSILAQELASMALEPDRLRELTELPEHRYCLPTMVKKVELFKGADFNVTELAEQLSKSDSFSRLFEKNKLDSALKRPLLPFKLGQIGLIGGSGLINGLVECDTPHILKGRITKKKNINKEENVNTRGEVTSTTIYETRSNQMILNILTPQGFRALVGDMSEDMNESGVVTTPIRQMAKTTTTAVNKVKFSLGNVVITTNARGVLTNEDINAGLTRHQSGDWGDAGQHDWKANDVAVYGGGRIISVYTSSCGDKYWVLTEADRSCTTILLPEDY